MTQNLPMDRYPIREITPQNLKKYLESRGWQKVKFGRENLIKFKSPYPINGTDEHLVILIPSTDKLFDYNNLINIALERISAFENRCLDDILAQILLVTNDSIKVQISTLDTQKGNIPTNDGISLYESLRDLLIFSACAELDPTKKAFSRKLKGAIDLVKPSLIGQSQYGSYIANIHFPLPRSYDRALGGEIIDPPQRGSILRILRGLKNVEDSVVAKDADPIIENYSRGLNSNMCAVLIDIIEVGMGSDINISANLDPMYPVPSDIITNIKLSSSSQMYLEKAVSILEEDSPEGYVELNGYVTQLKWNPEKNENDREIRIIAFGIEGHDTMSVKILLDEKSYQLAIEAHKDNNKILIGGVLEKVGRSWHLNRPTRLEIINRDYRNKKYKNLDSF